MNAERAFSSAVRKYYDIIITGGGMVGSVLACKLAKNQALSNLSVLLIESGPKKAWNSELNINNRNFSNRVSSLNNATKRLLQSVDVWDTVCSTRYKSVSQIKVWSNCSKNIVTTFNVTDVPYMDYLAYIVENNVLIAAAMEMLETLGDRVEVIHDSSVDEYNLPKSINENVILKLNDGRFFECELLLGTDGVNSKVRHAMGVQYLSWNYNQHAVVATLKINDVEENNTAWQKFFSTGPVALLPLSNGFSSLVWSTTPEHAKALLSLPKDSFIDALNAALWKETVNEALSNNIANAVGKFLNAINIKEERRDITPPSITDIDENSRASFLVGFGHAACYVAPRVALVGDAAHRVHPLAGQGVNLGFGDIECLNDIITKHIQCGAVLGHIDALREYETIRQRSNVLKLIGIDLIQRIVGHQGFPCLAVTNTGFQFANSILPLKKFLINIAAT